MPILHVRRPVGVIGSALAACAALAMTLASQAARAEIINVRIDQAMVMQLPDNTATIIIGNPVVADVTMMKKNSKMILTGKSFGSTNILALDASGNALGESVVRVSSGFKGLIVQRGMERESYDCAPRCQPTINPGDSSKYLGDTAGQIKQFGAISSGK